LRLFSFGGYGLALAALALVVFGAIECPPTQLSLAATFVGFSPYISRFVINHMQDRDSALLSPKTLERF